MTEPTRAEKIAMNDPRTCPTCGERGHRIQTRREVNGVHRRRECINKECRWRWTTIEIDLNRAQAVVALERAFNDVWAELQKHTPDMDFAEKLRSKPGHTAESPFRERSTGKPEGIGDEDK